MDRRRRAARTVALMSLFTMADTQTDVPIASFVGDGRDLISLIVGIEPIQAGSGDPSPDNVRPISGWTGANIHVSPTTDAADGTTYSITFPSSAGTVYGGTLDVTAGKLTVDRAMVDLGTLNWSTAVSVGITRFRAPVAGIKQVSLGTTLGQILCSNYEPKTANQTYIGQVGISQQQNTNDVYIYDPQKEALSAADFKAAMSGVQLCYELATPIVYDLTPTQVTTLIGTNNIWADTGDIKYIEYNI